MSRTRTAAIAAVAAATILPCVAAQASLPVYLFNRFPDADNPRAGLIEANGMLYGTTTRGGTSGPGAVYAVDPKTGAETVLYSFAGGADGSDPVASLTYGNGVLYGTTILGGDAACGSGSGCGTVFALDIATGVKTTLHAFAGVGGDGATPTGQLVYLNGTLYGTTSEAGNGTSCVFAAMGTVYALDAGSGAESVLHSFCEDSADGSGPTGGVIAHDGRLYGTTSEGGGPTAGGGASGNGTVFEVDPATGSEAVIYRFTGGSGRGVNDGASPGGPLIYHGGLLYGTTPIGGGQECNLQGCGTLFSVDPGTGAETVLYNFENVGGGAQPAGELSYRNGFLYGTARGDDPSSSAVVFKFDVATMAETVVYNFPYPVSGGIDGGYLNGGLVYATGHFYGTIYGGGRHVAPCRSVGCGAVYKVAP